MGLISWIKKRREAKRQAYKQELAAELKKELDEKEYFDILYGRSPGRFKNPYDSYAEYAQDVTLGIKLYDDDIGGDNADAHRPKNIKLYPKDGAPDAPFSLTPYESHIDDDTITDKIYYTTKKGNLINTLKNAFPDVEIKLDYVNSNLLTLTLFKQTKSGQAKRVYDLDKYDCTPSYTNPCNIHKESEKAFSDQRVNKVYKRFLAREFSKEEAKEKSF